MAFFNLFAYRQSLRLFRHELRRGELTIIFLAITIAVATVFSLSSFSLQIKTALINQSNSFIGADRVLQTSRVLDDEIINQAKAHNLMIAQQVLMSSMIFVEEKMQLVSLRAVSALYPLKGELLIRDKTGKTQAMHSPKQGEIWLAQKLFSALNISFDDSVEIGESSFKVSGVITQIPDASFSVFTMSPSVIINSNDLAKTQLIQPASRVTYKYLFAGQANDILNFEQWLKPKLNDTQRWYDIKASQSQLANALMRAEKFLSLASLLGIILAAVAVAVAARRYGQRHQNSVAVFKAMGASQGYIKQVYLLHWFILVIVSLLVGLIAGFVIQSIGLWAMADYLPVKAQVISFYPINAAIFTGLVCSFAFAFDPLRRLLTTPALHVIRQHLSTENYSLFRQIPALSALLALLLFFSQSFTTSFILFFSGIIIIVILLSLAHFIMRLSKKVGSQAGQAWQLALANLRRRAAENSVQLVSFTVAIQLLLLLFVLKSELLNDWQAQLPDDTANRFLINISAQQVSSIENFIEQQQLTASKFYPVVLGRLVAINNEKVQQKVSKDRDDKTDQGRQGIGRELNLTWQQNLPEKNTLVAGQWWSNDNKKLLVSVELKLAERLAIKLGDKLTFQLGNDVFVVTVANFRKVNWQSLQPNFYMIFSPNVLSSFPATYISSIYVPQAKEAVFTKFLSQYPTISLLDVDAILSQLRTVIGQVAIAIEFILILVVISGSLVLIAQVQATMDERQRDLAILRTLGAKGRLLRNSVLYEFLALGALAGLLASIVMEIALYFIQTQLFEMSGRFHGEFWLIAIAAGSAFVGIMGLLSCWKIINKKALIRHVV
jgi:putative ABC transport system permease protein